ncbi:MAG: hypothetical protein HYX32_09955 [Actinobacteria bacterium]|nr:hypothetical protein [Actinomycetota bacterium]
MGCGQLVVIGNSIIARRARLHAHRRLTCRHELRRRSTSIPTMRVELAYLEGWRHWRDAEARLLALQPQLGFELEYRTIASPEDAAANGLLGSPPITIDGADLPASSDQPVGFACRQHDTPAGSAGSPTIGQLRTALAAVSGPPTGGART